jgi:hypothetical protein
MLSLPSSAGGGAAAGDDRAAGDRKGGAQVSRKDASTNCTPTWVLLRHATRQYLVEVPSLFNNKVKVEGSVSGRGAANRAPWSEMSQMLQGSREPLPPDAIEAPWRLGMRGDRRRCSTDSVLQAVRADIPFARVSLPELIRIGFDTVKMKREIPAISLSGR